MKESYKCEYCGRKINVEDEKIPTCCGKAMKKQPSEVCLQPAHAEHARTMESEEPCDDGRAG